MMSRCLGLLEKKLNSSKERKGRRRKDKLKVEEFKKIGTCTGSYFKKRDWAVNVQAKLASLHTLAKSYKLEDKLYFSSIVP